MSVKKLPIWAAVLVLSSATLAYGQATQVPAPGGQLPPTTTPTPPADPGPGPTPTSGGTPAPAGSH